MKQKFSIEGMSCAACSAAVEKAVRRQRGVTAASVNLLGKTMLCEYDEGVIKPEQIIEAVQRAGFSAALYGAEESEGEQRGNTPLKTRLLWSAILLIPLMYLSMGHMLGLPLYTFPVAGELIYPLLQLLLTLPVVWLNRKFFIVGFGALRRRSPNMDSLVAIGAGASLLYGVFAIGMIIYSLAVGDAALGQHYAHALYFESAAMILTLVTVGKFLEDRSKGRTGAAVAALVKLAPDTACVLRDGVEQRVPTAQLAVGELVIIRPGERVPIDGEVVEGSSSVDESALTGESIPIEKTAGSRVMTATMNKNGRMTVRAERVGEDTTLAKIIGLVEDAGASKPPVARLADRVAAVFVPIVMAISLLTLVIWLIASRDAELAITAAISVLVISCPCALGLATPVAITVAVGRAAGEGIMLRSGEAIELLGGCDTVVLDKTGTLTVGAPSVTDVIPLGCTRAQLVRIATALERYSEHPLSEAILKLAEDDQGCEVTDFSAISGRGVSGVIDGEQYFGGNARLMQERGVELSSVEQQSAELAAQGKTVMYFAAQNRLLGLIAAADELRENSAEALERFRALGMDPVLLTGDNEQTAAAVAAQLSIKSVRANVLPQDKDSEIAALQAAGRRVVMIGDGINDSPALTRADVGIAVGGGTDVAIRSAGVVLMNNDLRSAARAVSFSRSVMKNIRENLFWAFFYNVIGIPIAAGVLFPFTGLLLSPMLAAAAMSLSSLFVVSNALRLYKK